LRLSSNYLLNTHSLIKTNYLKVLIHLTYFTQINFRNATGGMYIVDKNFSPQRADLRLLAITPSYFRVTENN